MELKDIKLGYGVKLKREEDENKATIKLNDFANEVHENAVNHGWWDKAPTFPEIIAMCHCELSEALREWRDDYDSFYYHDNDGDICTCITDIGDKKPEGVHIELIDCILRILDYLANEGADIEKLLTVKHEYNKGRTYRHGGKKI